MNFKEIKTLSSEYLFQNYGRIDISFTRGEGVYLYDTEGNEYLDLVSGIAVNCLGYSHPEWVEVMKGQISKLIHVSNLYYVEEQAKLAEKIARISPDGLNRTLFVNSGAEANEGALKMAVKYTKRSKVISAKNSFHGRTSAALGATGQSKYQEPFRSLISDIFNYFEFGNSESVKEAINKDVAALLIEPIQGEGGVITADVEFFKTVRDLCTDNGVVMIADEIQTGIGRTGKWFGMNNYDVVPDVITSAKALGGGMPIGAIISTEEISKVMTPGSHGTTFGGNPIVCTSGCAVIDIIEKEKLLQNVSKLGDIWKSEIQKINNNKIKNVRGKGFIIGIEMDSGDTAKHIQKYMLENGILVNVCNEKVVRLIPPLILTSEDKNKFMNTFIQALK